PEPPAARALRAALARHGTDVDGALRLAQRPEHARPLGRRSELSARRPVRRRHPLHPRGAAPLLDGDLAPVRPERSARAAACAPRGAGGGRAYFGTVTVIGVPTT